MSGLLLAVAPVTTVYTVTAGAVVGGTSGEVATPIPVPCVDAILGLPKLGQTHLGQVCSSIDLTDFRINGISLFDSRTQRTLKAKSLKISEQVTVNPNTCSFTLEGKGRDVETNTYIQSHSVPLDTMLNNWTTPTTTPSPAPGTMIDVAYGTLGVNNYTIAVGAHNGVYNIMHSLNNGTTWAQGVSSGADNKTGVAFGNNKFVCVGVNGFDHSIYYSPGGITWSLATTGVGALYSVVYANGLFVAVGEAGLVMTSIDGVTWTPQTSGTVLNLYRITYGGGLFVAVGANGVLLETVFTSVDGVVWVDRSFAEASPFPLQAIMYGNGLFIASGNAASIFTSPDTITWTERVPGGASIAFLGSTYAAGQFVLAGYGGYMYSSIDGITWTSHATGGGALEILYGVVYASSRYITVGGAPSVGTIYYSSSIFQPGRIVKQGDVIYAVGASSVTALNATTYAQIWNTAITNGQTIAVNPLNSNIAIGCSDGRVLLLNSSGTLLSSWSAGSTHSVMVGGFSTSDSKLYMPIAGTGVYANNIVVFNTNANVLQYVQTFSVRGTDPFQCLVITNENELYISNQGSNNLVVLNYTTNTVVANIALSSSPRGLTYSTRLNKVYIVTSDGNIAVIDGTTYTVMYSIPTYIPDGYDIAVDDDTARAYITRSTSSYYPVIIANLLTRVVSNCGIVGSLVTSSSVIVDRINLKLIVASPSGNSIMEFQTFSQLGVLPLGESIIEIYRNSRLYFAGVLTVPGKIIRLHHGQANDGNGYKVDCQAVDYSWLLTKTQLSKEYVNYYAGDIVRDVLASSNVALQGFTAGVITTGPLLAYEKFDNQTAFDIIKAVAEKSYLNWDVDVTKKVSLTNPVAAVADITIDETTGNYDHLTHEYDYSQLVNTVWVKGARILTAGYTSEYVGDGSRTVFDLQEGPSGITCTVGGVTKSLGVDNVDDPALFDGMISFSNGQVTLKVAPGAGAIVHFSYSRYIPTTVRVTTSETDPSGFHSKTYIGALLSGNGQFEHTITADNATTLQAAIDAGKAHLLQFGRPIFRGSFSSYTLSPITGSYAKIKIFDRGIDEIVQINQKNTSMLTNQKFVYQIRFTSIQKDKYDALMQTLIKYTMPQTGFVSETANIKLHPIIEEVVI